MILGLQISSQLLLDFLKQLEQLGVFPSLGIELEFYLNPICSNLQEKFADLDIVPERGKNQFEIRIKHSKDIIALIENVEDIKKRLVNYADFSTKANNPGNGLHVNLHLENSRGDNLFIKQEYKESELLLYAIGGLCATMQENLLLFAPNENSYLRFNGESIESPCKICWGINNRSAAIRLPLHQQFNRIIEHRVAGSDACIIEVIIAILLGVITGIKERINPPERLYGNANLEQYDFPYLAQNLREAQENFLKSRIKALVEELR